MTGQRYDLLNAAIRAALAFILVMLFVAAACGLDVVVLIRDFESWLRTPDN